MFVKCIDNLEGQISLTEGVKYRVINESEHFYRLVNDCGGISSYMKHCFEVVEEEPKFEVNTGYIINGKRVVFENEGDVIQEGDNVNHPSHYNHGGIETYDVIKGWLSKEELIGYLRGNIIKYQSRANYKNNKEEDLKKAEWYTNKLKEVLEGDK